jgi:hypothetical protein
LDNEDVLVPALCLLKLEELPQLVTARETILRLAYGCVIFSFCAIGV